MNSLAIYLGSILLGIGVCSPGISTDVNAHCAELVFFGLALLVTALCSDARKDRSAR